MSAQESIPPPPVVGELEAIFKALPDAELLAQLRGPKRRGRPGYAAKILWRCYLTRYVLGIESVSALLRLLRDNPYIARACGIDSPDKMPSQPTLSRFGTKLSILRFKVALRNVQRSLTRRMYDTLPGFGKMVAIDSTDLKGWSNPSQKGTRKKSPIRRQRPRRGKVSDGDAGWSVKTNTRGNKQFTWGFKAHILCDALYELPMVVSTSPGNRHDVKEATPLLAQARYATSRFHPDYVLCDSGYSSEQVRRSIRRNYRATPIIDPNPGHKKAVERQELIPNWREIYKQRSAIERLNGRLKGFFALDSLRVRGRRKVLVHAHMSVIALQARALAFPEQLRQCVRAA